MRVRPTLRVALSIVTLALPASAETGCVPTDLDRCKSWTVVYDDPSRKPRSDQFVTSIAAGPTTVYITLKDVAFDIDRPYEQTSAWQVLAIDATTGVRRWTATRSTRAYEMPLASVLSPDGSRLYVTGAAYDAFPIVATDSTLTTVGYDTATGAAVWSATWDSPYGGKDNGKAIAISPSGREVYVSVASEGERNQLDYVTISYSTANGHERWSARYTGLGGQDAPFGLAAAPDGEHVYVTGWSDGVVEFDVDYATVAYSTKKGRVAWVARYDGVGADKSDRAQAIAVSPDGRVYVSGDSYGGVADGRIRYDYATVGYDGTSGAEVWQARYAGPIGGFNAPHALAASAVVVVVTGQSTGASADDSLDYGTVGYDVATGAERWRARYAPPRSSDLPLGLALSPDGGTAYVTGRSTSTVTGLTEQATLAYRVADGTLLWSARFAGTGLDRVSGYDVAALPDRIFTTATLDRANLGPDRNANRYDTVIAAYPT